jgi:phage gp36-like protein
MASRATEAEFNALGLPAVALDGFSGDVQDHLDAASAKVDSHIRGRYLLPLVAPYPPEIVEAECVLAAYSLLSIRGFDPEAGANQNVVQRYKDTMKWLGALSEGKVSLAIEADSTSDTYEGGPKVRSRSSRSTGGYCSTCCSYSCCCRGFWGNGRC